MIKKLTLTSLTAFALLTGTVHATDTQAPAMQKMGQKQGMKQKKKHSPFLIKHGLPHMTKMMMQHWDDEKLALTPEQKEKLLVIRKETIGGVKQLKPEVMQLTKAVVQASKAGESAASLKEKVDKLAQLEAEATMIHLNCIEKTNAVLTPAQKSYLQSLRQAKKMAKKEMKQKMKGQGGMKCASGKCGMAK